MSLRLIVVAGVLGAEVIIGSLFAQDLSFEESVAANPLEHDNYDAAIVIYTKVLARNPRHTAYYDRGVIYLMNGNFAKAIADLIQALRLDPNKVAHYSALAVAYAEQGSKLKRPDDCDKAPGRRQCGSATRCVVLFWLCREGMGIPLHSRSN